ncbi:MAG: flagellar motor protein MotB, partial [bacterium]
MAIYRSRREELENQLNKGALWAVTYGDLMSYLMIFFLVLFSFSIAKTDKAKSRKYEESLGNIQKAFGGKANQKRIDRATAQENEEG